MFVMGCVFRLWTLSVLLLLKHSEGDTCIGRIINLSSKWMHKLGYDAILRPKAGDAVDSVLCIMRKPGHVKDNNQRVGRDSGSGDDSAATVVVVGEKTTDGVDC